MNRLVIFGIMISAGLPILLAWLPGSGALACGGNRCTPTVTKMPQPTKTPAPTMTLTPMSTQTIPAATSMPSDTPTLPASSTPTKAAGLPTVTISPTLTPAPVTATSITVIPSESVTSSVITTQEESEQQGQKAGADDELPQTGIGLGGTAAISIALVVLIMIVRGSRIYLHRRERW